MRSARGNTRTGLEVTPNASVAVYLEFQRVSRIDDSGPSFRQKDTRVQYREICAEIADQRIIRGFCLQTVQPLIRTSFVPWATKSRSRGGQSAGSLPSTYGGYEN
jgi:hypothetical protein